MMNKRLLRMVPESRRFVYAAVAFQWLALLANMSVIFSAAYFINGAVRGDFSGAPATAGVFAGAIILRFLCIRLAAYMSFKASARVKTVLREKILGKLLRLGANYRDQVSTSEVTQLTSEGVEQLETWFGQYLPQLFYALLAPLTLFAALSFVNMKSAALLLACVPLIPIIIMAVQKFAKRLLSKYWKRYTDLGDVFLENVQGLTTLKIYQADEYRQERMEHHAELFRKATMKVLAMQLNSIAVMDLVAYGGAALGIVIAVSELGAGRLNLGGALAVILLSAEFFIPMRLLGSFFHIAMNGMAAGKKIFRLIDTPEIEDGTEELTADNCNITLENMSFSYAENREILKNITLNVPANTFTAIVGESGCGKSTIAALLSGENKGYSGSVRIGGKELRDIAEHSLMKHITLVSDNSYLFAGTLRDNLLMGNEKASASQMWAALEKVNIADFLKAENGLDTVLSEKGANLSGGQRQRIAIARALLHDSPIYIFDEATSNIDAESEGIILSVIHALAKTKTVLFISHRLANAVAADNIFVLKDGELKERGKHKDLLAADGAYAKLYNTQKELEQYAGGAVYA